MNKKLVFFFFILPFSLFSLTQYLDNGIIANEDWEFSKSYEGYVNDTLIVGIYGGNVVLYDTLLNPIDTLTCGSLVKSFAITAEGNYVIGFYRGGYRLFSSEGNLLNEDDLGYSRDIVTTDTSVVVSDGNNIRWFDNSLNQIKEHTVLGTNKLYISSDTLFLCDSIGGFSAINVNSADTLFSTDIKAIDMSVKQDTAYLVITDNIIRYDILNGNVIDTIPLSGIKGVYAADSGIIAISGAYNLYAYLFNGSSFIDTVYFQGIVRGINGYENTVIVNSDYYGENIFRIYDDSLEYINIDRYGGIRSVAYNEWNNLVYATEGGNNGIFVLNMNDDGKLNLLKRIDYGGAPNFIRIIDDTLLFAASAWRGLQIFKIISDSLELLSYTPTRSAQALDKIGDYCAIADYNRGIKIIDVSDLYSPIITDSIVLDGNVYGIKFVNDTLIVASQYTVPGTVLLKVKNGIIEGVLNKNGGYAFCVDIMDSFIISAGDSIYLFSLDNDTLNLLNTTGTGGTYYGIYIAPWENEVFVNSTNYTESWIINGTDMERNFRFYRPGMYGRNVWYKNPYLMASTEQMGILTFITDLVAPVCDSTNPPDNYAVSDTFFEMEFFVSDDKSGIKELNVSMDAILPDSFLFDTLNGFVYALWNSVSEGSHAINLFMSDTANNSINYSFNENIDFTSPVINSIYPVNEWVGNSVVSCKMDYYDMSDINAIIVINNDTVVSHIYEDSLLFDIAMCNDTFNVYAELIDVAGNSVDTNYVFMGDTENIKIEALSPAMINVDTNVIMKGMFFESNPINSPIDTIVLRLNGEEKMFNVFNDTLVSDTILLQTGKYFYSWYIKDVAGNETYYEDSFIVDNKNPIITEVYPYDSSYINISKPTVSIFYEEDFPTIKKLSFDGEDVTNNCIITNNSIEYVPLDSLEDGRHFFEVFINDTAGNICSDTFVFYVDTQTPFIQYISPSIGEVVCKYDTLKIVPSEELSLYILQLDGQEMDSSVFVEDTILFWGYLGEGWHKRDIVLKDRALNKYIYIDSFAIDRTPPQGVMFEQADTIVRGGALELLWTKGEDNIAGIETYKIYIDDSLYYCGDNRTMFVYVSNGDHKIKLFVSDSVGNDTLSDSLSINVISGIDNVKIYPNPMKLSENRIIYFEGLTAGMVLSLYDDNGRLMYKVNGTLTGKTTLFFDKQYRGVLRYIIKDENNNIKKGIIGIK